jgi:hypothetical protein
MAHEPRCRPAARSKTALRPVSPDVPQWSVPDLKEYLSGSWSVDRLVIDHLQMMIGQLQGEATFRPSGLGLVYEERGTLMIGEHRGQAEQTYLYDFTEGDARALVRFRDGRPFHDLDLSTGHDCPFHLCPPDRYAGVILALGPTSWRTEWKVTGPRKDYDLVTTYTRRAAQPA